MCRLFGLLSPIALNASQHLLEDPCSLYIQGNVDPERLQSDGWGIGFYGGGRSHLIKSHRPVYEEYERFASAVQKANSKVILAHIRRASNPRKLPREKIISTGNSQPFGHERYLFAHNGTITIPDEVAESLGEWKRRIGGANDSEVYFWYILKEVTRGASFPDALKRFEKALTSLWLENREKHLDKDRPYIGLNALFSDGERLYAYCKYQKEDETEESLCLKDQLAFQMSYLTSPERLVVASEKTNTAEDWKLLKSGHLLTGQIKQERVVVDLQEI